MSFIIRLQNLSRSAKSTDIRSFFNSLSIPNGSVCIVGSNEAFIGFSTDEDARQAMLRDGGQLCGNTVRLSLSSRKEMSDAMKRAQDLRQVLKGLEDAIRTDSLSEDAIKTVRNILDNGADALERISQSSASVTSINDQLPISSSVATNSRQQNSPKPAENEGSWKDFLASALKRIESANEENDQSSSVERFTGYSYPQSRSAIPNVPQQTQSRPAPPDLIPQPQGRPSQPNIVQHFQNPASRNTNVFEPPSRLPQNSHFIRNNGAAEPPIRPPQIPHFMPPHESGGNRREPLDPDELLRQQQLAAVQNMDVPTVPQNYDPEELFVELSRLPPNLLDLRALKDFLSPVIPMEARVAAENGVHINTILFCGNKKDSFAIMKRDGEYGIRIRWSNRSSFFSLPPVLDGGLWTRSREQSNWRNEEPLKRPTTDWNDQRPPKRSHWDSVEPNQNRKSHWDSVEQNQTEQLDSWLNPNSRFDGANFLLITSVPYRATVRDIQSYAAELNVPVRNSVQIFESDSDRSDTWIVELSASKDLRTIMSAGKPMLGRRLKFERLTPEAASETIQNGAKNASWQRRNSRQLTTQIPQPTTSNMGTSSSQRGGFFNSAPLIPRRNIHSDNNSTPYFPNSGNRTLEMEQLGSMNWGFEQNQMFDDDQSERNRSFRGRGTYGRSRGGMNTLSHRGFFSDSRGRGSHGYPRVS